MLRAVGIIQIRNSHLFQLKKLETGLCLHQQGDGNILKSQFKIEIFNCQKSFEYINFVIVKL